MYIVIRYWILQSLNLKSSVVMCGYWNVKCYYYFSETLLEIQNAALLLEA